MRLFSVMPYFSNLMKEEGEKSKKEDDYISFALYFDYQSSFFYLKFSLGHQTIYMNKIK